MRLYKRLILVILWIILEISCTDRSERHCKPLPNTRIEVALHITYDACVGVSYNQCQQLISLPTATTFSNPYLGVLKARSVTYIVLVVSDFG
uniref:Secreted protein n=1 Tax=Panagrellus redivivus TaxID=6233 RepID=A0A7E4V4G8_PANRE